MPESPESPKSKHDPKNYSKRPATSEDKYSHDDVLEMRTKVLDCCKQCFQTILDLYNPALQPEKKSEIKKRGGAAYKALKRLGQHIEIAIKNTSNGDKRKALREMKNKILECDGVLEMAERVSDYYKQYNLQSKKESEIKKRDLSAADRELKYLENKIHTEIENTSDGDIRKVLSEMKNKIVETRRRVRVEMDEQERKKQVLDSPRSSASANDSLRSSASAEDRMLEKMLDGDSPRGSSSASVEDLTSAERDLEEFLNDAPQSSASAKNVLDASKPELASAERDLEEFLNDASQSSASAKEVLGGSGSKGSFRGIFQPPPKDHAPQSSTIPDPDTTTTRRCSR